jgi:predicted ATPase/DNA-binding winged helix-turn-helix (wHTH) protein
VRFRFGDGYELDLERYELSRHGAAVHLEPQVFDVLAYLVENHHRVISKEELLDEVWGDRFVSESALTSRLKAARRAVGDDGRTQAVIRTVHGRGYEFHAAVEAVGGSGGRGAEDEGFAPRAPPVGIPRPRGPILGREDDLARLFDVVAEERLTTVLGPGGTGKTRLATEFALGWPPERSAIAFVELAIQVGQRVDLRQSCVEYLRAVEHLLVIDNCEHLVDATAELLDDFLTSCPDLRILTTSRIPLGLANEMIFRLDPLPVPEPGSPDIADAPVIALFARRARRANQDFSLDPTTAEQVRALCSSLDGLPLAVELAAGRLGAFELEDLQRRLDRRLDLIAGAPESGEDRHRTLRNTLAWSYDLLDAEDQRLMRHLSVFPAGVPLAAVEWIGERLGLAGDPAVVLSHLVDASVVVRKRVQSSTRYAQLETVRAFGLDRLEHHGERADAEALLVEWVKEAGELIAEGIRSSDEEDWDSRARRSLPNIRAARQLMIEEGDLVGAAALSWNLDWWARFRGHSEVWQWAEDLLDRREELAPEWRNRVTAMAAQTAWLRGRLETAEELALEVVDSDPTPEELHHAYTSLATVSLWQGRFADAVTQWTASEQPFLDSNDLASAAIAEAYQGRFAEARDLLAQARAEAGETGVPGIMCWVDYATGEVEATAGSGAHEPHLDSAIAAARRLRLVFPLGVAMVTRASHDARVGNTEAAAAAYLELLDLWLRCGSRTQLWTTLRNAAELLVGIDDRIATRLWAAADTAAHASVLTGDPAKRRDALHDEIEGRLGPETVEELEAEARSGDLNDLIDEATAALRCLTEAAPTEAA